MTDRVLEFAEGPALLSVRDRQLVIRREENLDVTTPLDELGVLVITHPRVQVTQAVIAEMANAGGMVVVCDNKYQPAAMMLPMQAHFVQTERYAIQAQLPQPVRKRLWQQIVQAKLRAQGRLLKKLHGADGGISAMAARVGSGDPENLEAQAARRYWPLIFGDPKFRRGSEGPDQNNHLNYGYMVLRAVCARAICAAGLHPSMGLRHHNRYDAFCLASDLMEPFRPLVDRLVVEWIRENDPTQPLDRFSKAHLLRLVTERYLHQNEERSLFDWVAGAANAMCRVMMGDAKKLELPEL